MARKPVAIIRTTIVARGTQVVRVDIDEGLYTAAAMATLKSVLSYVLPWSVPMRTQPTNRPYLMRPFPQLWFPNVAPNQVGTWKLTWLEYVTLPPAGLVTRVLQGEKLILMFPCHLLLGS